MPVSFAGMANTRWWTFEDAKTNYGDVDAATTDLAKLMFLEFALVYANDWFVIPWTLPDGVVASVRGIAVTNVFGERLWISSADEGADAGWQRWSMFTVGVTGGPTPRGTDPDLVLLPSAAKIDQGPPTEDVHADPRRGREHGLGRGDRRAAGHRRHRPRARAGPPPARLPAGPGAGGGPHRRRPPRSATRS